MLTGALKQQIKEYSLINPHEERCGLILQSGNGTFIYPCRNISANKKHHFELNPLDYLRAWDGGKNKIIGIFHSQTNLPSSLDYFTANFHSLYSIVYSIDEDKFIEIKQECLKWKDYLGKNFEIGKQDCFTLVRNFYKKEYNLDINDYNRDDKWFEKNPTIIKDNYFKEGFVEIEHNIEKKDGDVLVFNSGHFGIYIIPDLLLHHPRNKNSIIEHFNRFYKKILTNIYRHKSKYEK